MTMDSTHSPSPHRVQLMLLMGLGMVLSCQPATSTAVIPEDTPEPPPADTAQDTAAAVDTGADTGQSQTEDPPEWVPGYTWEHPGVLIIDTLGQTIVAETKIDATLDVVRAHDGTLTDLETASRAWSGMMGIEIHGSSSAGFAKKNYRIELRDEDGDDLAYGLLDMPREADWILHGPYSDKTLIRNAMAYGLGRAISTGQWQPRTAFAEVVINGEYQGVYLVVERPERSADRIDIAQVSDEDPTGGYIIKSDQNRGDGWQTVYGTRIDYHHPKSEAITPIQDEWIKGWFDDMEAVMKADDFAEHWPEWLDGESFIDHYIINELSLNVDGYRLSGYLHLDTAEHGSGKLVAGPLWDFNLAFGNSDYCYCWGVEGHVYDALARCGSGDQEPFWWQRLLEDPAYVEALRCRWDELRMGPLSDTALQTMIAGYQDELSNVAGRNHSTWGVLGVYVWPNYYVGQTWDDEVDYLEDWMLGRAAWLDDNLRGECPK